MEPWLVDVPPGFEDLPCGFVVVHRDDDRLYWTGMPEARWSGRARDALVSECAAWEPGRNLVPAEGRCVMVITDGVHRLPLHRWPGRD